MEFKEYLKELKRLEAAYDTECAHVEADDLLCKIAVDETLTLSQKKKLVKAYREIPKWYS